MPTLPTIPRAPRRGAGGARRLRPDLVVPVPADLSALAVRAQSRLSVARALDSLDRFTPRGARRGALPRVRRQGPRPPTRFSRSTAQSGAEPRRCGRSLHGCATGLVTGRTTRCTWSPRSRRSPRTRPDSVGVRPTWTPPRRRWPPTRPACAGPCSARRSRPVRCSTGWPPDRRSARSRAAGRGLAGALAAGTPPAGAVADDTVELPREVALVLRRDAGPLGPVHPAAAGHRRARSATEPTRPAPDRRSKPSGTPRSYWRRSPRNRPRCCARVDWACATCAGSPAPPGWRSRSPACCSRWRARPAWWATTSRASCRPGPTTAGRSRRWRSGGGCSRRPGSRCRAAPP